MPEPEIMLTYGGEPPALNAGGDSAQPQRRRLVGKARRMRPVVAILSLELPFWMALALSMVALASCTLKLELASHGYAKGDLAAASMGLAPPARWTGEQAGEPKHPRRTRPALDAPSSPTPDQRPPLLVQLAPNLTLAPSSGVSPPVRIAGLPHGVDVMLPTQGRLQARPETWSSWTIRRAAAPALRPAAAESAYLLAPIPKAKPALARSGIIPLPEPKPILALLSPTG